MSFTELAKILRTIPGTLDRFIESEGVQERYPLEICLDWFSSLGLA